MHFRDLGAALVGFTAAYTWQSTRQYLMEPSALRAALLVSALVLVAMSVAMYVTAVVKRPQPQATNRRPPRSAKQVRSTPPPRSPRAGQASNAEASASA